MNKRFAAIDIGTNSFHMTVAELYAKTASFRILNEEKVTIRMGAGSSDIKYLKKGSMAYGIMCLTNFSKIARNFKAECRAVATSAVREAVNKNEFIELAKRETGIDVEVISGNEEARLIYLGAIKALPIFGKKVLLFDIGGGSTEIIVAKGFSVGYTNSIKLGAVRLTEKFFPQGNINEKSVKECSNYIDGMLSQISREVKHIDFDIAVATSGTAECLQKIFLNMSNSEGVNNESLSASQVERVLMKILEKEHPESRKTIKGLESERADIIPAGAIVFNNFMKNMGIESVLISKYALREGILHEKARAISDENIVSGIKSESIERMLVHYEADVGHAKQVSFLSEMLFKKLFKELNISEDMLDILKTAAILHDIGAYVSHSQHHRHSYYLIRNSDIAGYNENEKELIANIARYHRKSHPKKKHEGFLKLTDEERLTVASLAGILRIADGLDRSHCSYIEELNVEKTKNETVIKVKTKEENINLELWGADNKKMLLEEILNSKITIEKLLE